MPPRNLKTLRRRQKCVARTSQEPKQDVEIAMNKKIVAGLALCGMVASAPAMAAPGGVVGGVVGTLQTVLADVPGTLTTVVQALPVIVNDTVAAVDVAGGAVGPLLLGSPGLQSRSQSITVPLPGPAFLNATVLNVPGTLGVTATGGGPIVVTITTGPR